MGAQFLDAQLLETQETPSSGDLTPSSGDLTPSSGDLTPSSGDLTPSSGDLAPSSGDIQVFETIDELPSFCSWQPGYSLKS
jgi:hypothetical protein